MMTCVTISAKWYNDIKDLVKTENPYFYTDSHRGEMVEVDVAEADFVVTSRRLGWMY